jgi:replication-associated recombination protein RarA
MNADALTIARYQLREAVFGFRTTECRSLDVSPWVAMSLLQKAIRRGHEDLAQRAAGTLLLTSPERLWRRLGCIAFEDIGVADFETVSLVTAALAGKRFRATCGGEWPVASFIMCKTADSDEVGPAFQSEAGRYSELMPARYSDAKPATWCVARAGRLV